jgi:hypothetical protein
MSKPEFDTSLAIDLELLPAKESGLGAPISNGYRPLCVIDADRGNDEVAIGLCQLELAGALAPGERAHAHLSFAPSVSELARRELTPGREFRLAEGGKTIGTATVIGDE